MGYNLYIGEFEGTLYPEDRSASLGVEAANGGPQTSAPWEDTGNEICPSYTAWAQFAKRHGLTAVFFNGGRGQEWDEDYGNYGLLASHPGASAIGEEELRRFREALKSHGTHEDVEHWRLSWEEQNKIPMEYWDFLRLRWLVYWTEWALENCEYPTFANS